MTTVFIGSSNLESSSRHNGLAGGVAACGVSEKTLVVDSSDTLTGNLTIPSNVNLQFTRGSVITIDPGVTLTILGGIEAGAYQIFSGTGVATFNGSSTVPEVRPEWWGAVADGSTDSSFAIQAAIDALPIQTTEGSNYERAGGIVRFSSSNSPYVASGINVAFNQSCQLLGNGPSNTILKQTDAADDTFLKVRSFQGFRMEGIRCERGPGQAQNNIGIDIGTEPEETDSLSRWVEIHNCWSERFETGWQLSFIQRGSFSHMYAVNNGGVGIRVESATIGGTFRDCVARENYIGVMAIRNSVSSIFPALRWHGGIIESNKSVNMVLDSVADCYISQVHFEGNPGEPAHAHVELRQTVGTEAVEQIVLDGIKQSGTAGSEPFIHAITSGVYGGGQFRNIQIMNPSSGTKPIDLTNIARSFVLAPISSSITNPGFQNSIIRTGSHLGAGAQLAGSWYKDTSVLPVNSATPATREVGIWTTANTAPTTITKLVDTSIAGKELTLVLQDNNTGFTHGTSGSDALRLAGGEDWTTAASGDSISFVRASFGSVYQWVETGRSTEDVVTTANDVEVTTSGNGLILTSPDGTRYRITMKDGGNLITTAI